MSLLSLFTPLTLGHAVLPHRIIMGSMHVGAEDLLAHPERGQEAAADLAAFYAERVRGGAGLIVTGGISPNPAGALTPDGAVLSPDALTESPDLLDRHRTVTRAVKEAHMPSGLGASDEGTTEPAPDAVRPRILLQLLHAGRYAAHPGAVSASPTHSPISRFPARELSRAEVQQTVQDFAAAARLARDAGYDGVEIMGSEGYLINQFLSPLTNLRTDEYGGSRAGRQRFALEVTRAVREAIGDDGILSFRISLDDLMGISQSEADVHELARHLVAAGVDLLSGGVGWHESRTPTIATCVPRGAFTPLAAAAADAIRDLPGRSGRPVPVAASNRLHTVQDAADALSAGVDLVSLARPFLADPMIVAKWRSAASAHHQGSAPTPTSPASSSPAPSMLAPLTPCISCNQACLDRVFTGRPAGCVVNPRAGQERRLLPIPQVPAATARPVIVVGAGPAGAEAACRAAEAGHRVMLVDASEEIGGQLRWARAIPGKEDYQLLIDSWRARLTQAGVELRLGQAAGAQTVTALVAEQTAGSGVDPAVIIATGVQPRTASIPGLAEHPRVLAYADLFAQAPTPNQARELVGERVIVIGGGGIGVDMAQFLTHEVGGALAADRPQVTLLQRSPHAVRARLGATTGWIHRVALRRAGVVGISSVDYLQASPTGISIRVPEADGTTADQHIEADTIVVCAGQESERNVADELTAMWKQTGGASVHVIGGAKEAHGLDLEAAVRDADAAVRAVSAP